MKSNHNLLWLSATDLAELIGVEDAAMIGNIIRRYPECFVSGEDYRLKKINGKPTLQITMGAAAKVAYLTETEAAQMAYLTICGHYPAVMQEIWSMPIVND